MTKTDDNIIDRLSTETLRALCKKAMAERDEADARIEALDTALAEAVEILRPFADESLLSGPHHDFVTVKRSLCDAARAFVEKHGNGAAVVHASDCAVHNEPALPNGPCDCGAEPPAPRAAPQEPVTAEMIEAGANEAIKNGVAIDVDDSALFEGQALAAIYLAMRAAAPAPAGVSDEEFETVLSDLMPMIESPAISEARKEVRRILESLLQSRRSTAPSSTSTSLTPAGVSEEEVALFTNALSDVLDTNIQENYRADALAAVRAALEAFLQSRRAVAAAKKEN